MGNDSGKSGWHDYDDGFRGWHKPNVGDAAFDQYRFSYSPGANMGCRFGPDRVYGSVPDQRIDHYYCVLR